MNKVYCLLFIGLFLAGCVPRENYMLISPDGRIEVQFKLVDEGPFYQVRARLQPVLSWSRLGFLFADSTRIQQNLTLKSVRMSVHDTTWYPVWGTDSTVHDQYNQMEIALRENSASGRELKILFRAYNDGIAFRYLLPAAEKMDSVFVADELTEFRFAADNETWWIERDYDSYEKLYRHTKLSEVKPANTPLTMRTASGMHLVLHEAALTDYPAMTLEPGDSLILNCALVPGPQGVKARVALPFKTPWRTLHIVSEAANLLESHLIENLNEPCKIKDTSWIKPMKYVGIWWGMHIGKWTWTAGPRHGATTQRTKFYIDFAARNGIGGVLVEGWNQGWETWGKGLNLQNYTTPYADYNLPWLAAYAAGKGVTLIGHHETGSNVTAYEAQMAGAMTYLHKNGIRAVKSGYVGPIIPKGEHHHGQWMVRHYRRVVHEAARNQIMLDVHEPIKPTGIRRTWPNMMSREGVRGMEYNAWSEGNPPNHTTIIPFTRMVAGPLDYTPGIFDLQFDASGEHRVHTTLAKQLALYVVLYSPLQMAADLIENYEGNPAFQFIRDVPVTWDETRGLKSEIGAFVQVARRKGSDWYLAGITNGEARQTDIKLDFLQPGMAYKMMLYHDAQNTDYDSKPHVIAIDSITVNSESVLKTNMKKSGGFAARIVPAVE